MKQKLTKRKLNALIRDERMATREYKQLGFKTLSRDESKHAKFLIAKKNSLKQRRREGFEDYAGTPYHLRKAKKGYDSFGKIK